MKLLEILQKGTTKLRNLLKMSNSSVSQFAFKDSFSRIPTTINYDNTTLGNIANLNQDMESERN